MKIHILGICGTFMGGLAQILKESGHEVTGSDKQFYPPMSDHLISLNIKTFTGFSVKDMPKADLYIIGNALSRGNPCVELILKNKLPFKSGPEILGEILKDREVIAISGTHGKTSVTSMIAHALTDNGENPSYLIAGIPKGFNKSWDLTESDYFVIEADEYDTAFFDKKPKFFHYKPDILIINNIEFDHADIYKNIEEIEKNFIELIEGLPKESKIYINSSGISQSFLETIKENIKIKAKIEIFNADAKDIYEINRNITVKGLQEIISAGKVRESLNSYKGVKRRYDTIFDSESHKVIDDFAHHPTAIKETIKIANEENEDVTLIVELGSNSMRKGIHDDALIEIFKENHSYVVSASEEQQKKFADYAEPLTGNAIKNLLQKSNSKKTILMCGNKNFEGFQTLILDSLI